MLVSEVLGDCGRKLQLSQSLADRSYRNVDVIIGLVLDVISDTEENVGCGKVWIMCQVQSLRKKSRYTVNETNSVLEKFTADAYFQSLSQG